VADQRGDVAAVVRPVHQGDAQRHRPRIEVGDHRLGVVLGPAVRGVVEGSDRRGRDEPRPDGARRRRHVARPVDDAASQLAFVTGPAQRLVYPACRWTTTSTPAVARATAASSSTDAATTSAWCGQPRGAPPRASPRTSWPAPSAAATTARPTQPVAPVTSQRAMFS
jgi:hypothetical protein